MPIWWPCWISAAASSAVMMRLARLEFSTREGLDTAELDIAIPFEVQKCRVRHFST